MAIVEQLQPIDAPVVSIQLTLAEAKGLVTLLGSGVDSGYSDTLKKLDLTSLYTTLNMIYPEYRSASFNYTAELDYVEKD